MNGTVSGSVFSGYATSSSVAAKENLLTAVAPLLKAAAGANTQLSLDTTAAYTVGNLTATGTVSGTGFATLLANYATSTSLNAKENVILVNSPLVKTTPLGNTQIGRAHV